ncbi:lipopolysaccharide biosynthesis protein [Heyndrickxia oleronia]|uniref:lipopolysaccharide biosynthesis protein n=1 Tax=Heyndrickxia oleronia TaxID=38875 RepID=UPI00242D7564|nr:lipopolysaccharide biosynthesis protein [Heyndrickxia oleronia]MCI1590689.1 lipopolysaccharide biosynthesis protein [Heyndrickxia oleronia]MCI1612122.1 lipopolysaccharide biosynthesis protein [Heyndrickxia oleronia]MCI1759831.1 lipopolysaccharide biosynthesis protein [Heyndrickxia oleronia]
MNASPNMKQENDIGLKQQTMKGLFWSFSDLMANQGIQFIIQIVLARLLLPEHFGLIGMIVFFIAISNTIIDSGVSQALIREQNINQSDYSTAFYFNLIMSLFVYIILYFIAPIISSFYREDQLTLIIRILAIGIIINSLGLVQQARLVKNIDFKSQTKISIVSGLLSGTIAIILAYRGFGIWSLVLKTLIMQFLQTVLLWFSNKWIPSLVFHFTSFKRLFGFGSKLMLAGLFSSIYSNIYYLLIGRMYSASQLGFYTNASKLNDVASQSITVALQRVTYPVLSSIQDEDERLKLNFKKMIKMSTFIHFPIMFGLAAIAHPLVVLIFGEKWEPMVIYLQLLYIAGMLYPLHAINLNILQVKGKSNLYLLISIVKKVSFTLLLIGAIWLRLGVIGLVTAAVLESFISFWINSYFSGKEIAYSSFDQVKDIFLILINTIIMGVIVYICGLFLIENNLLKICLQIIIGNVVYIGISKITKVKELSETWNIFVSTIKKLRVRKVNLHSKG